jgi:hypothetical protein
MIPTTEEFINFLEAKGLIFPNEKERVRAKKSLIEFAKLHVEQFRQELLNNDCTEENLELYNSILNAYPLENIK